MTSLVSLPATVACRYHLDDVTRTHTHTHTQLSPHKIATTSDNHTTTQCKLQNVLICIDVGTLLNAWLVEETPPVKLQWTVVAWLQVMCAY